MKSKWKVDLSFQESIEESLERIQNAFLNRKPYSEVILSKRKTAEKQKERQVLSSPCCGLSFSVKHYPPALLNCLIECGGILTTTKISFVCRYGENGGILMRTNANSLVREENGEWRFYGSCFGCQTLKLIATNAIFNYYNNLKVSHSFPLSPTYLIHKWYQWLGYWFIFFKEYLLTF